MCGVCFKCEWLGTTQIPVHNCCGTVSTGCFIVNSYAAFCRNPNEHKCRNCILCTIPFTCAAVGTIIPFMCELSLIPVCTCCGYSTGHPCTCYSKMSDVTTTGFPTTSDLGPVIQVMKS